MINREHASMYENGLVGCKRKIGWRRMGQNLFSNSAVSCLGGVFCMYRYLASVCFLVVTHS